eukprot:c18721_g1_i1 orf=1-726(-)
MATSLFFRVLLFSLFLCSFASTSLGFVAKGKVFCDSCNDGRLTTSSSLIEGAVVAVRCTSLSGAQTAYVEGKTGKDGEFSIHVTGAENSDACVAALLRSPSSECNVLTAQTVAKVSFDAADGQTVTGPFSFRPSKVPAACASAVAGEMRVLTEGYYSSPAPSSPSPEAKPSPSPAPSGSSPSYKPPSSSSPSPYSGSSPSYKPPSSGSGSGKPPSSGSSPSYKPPSSGSSPSYTPPSSGSSP